MIVYNNRKWWALPFYLLCFGISVAAFSKNAALFQFCDLQRRMVLSVFVSSFVLNGRWVIGLPNFLCGTTAQLKNADTDVTKFLSGLKPQIQRKLSAEYLEAVAPTKSCRMMLLSQLSSHFDEIWFTNQVERVDSKIRESESEPPFSKVAAAAISQSHLIL